MDLARIEIKTLNEYMQVVLAFSRVPNRSNEGYDLYDCILEVDRDNPELLAKFKLEHELAYQTPLVTGEHLKELTYTENEHGKLEAI